MLRLQSGVIVQLGGGGFTFSNECLAAGVHESKGCATGSGSIAYHFAIGRWFD